jgi:hypothetical protein
MSEDLKRPDEVDEMKMDEFERALTKAMRRVDAPETLMRFLERATEMKQERVLPWKERKHKFAFYLPKPGMWMGGVGIGIAAALVLSVFVGEQVHVRHQREQAAEQQFETATRITDRALEHTREQLQRAGVPLD